MTSAAVDFGAESTKLAIFDRRLGGPVICVCIPSVAYVPRYGQIIVGQAAKDAIQADPLGAIDDLKSRLNRKEFTRNRRRVCPQELASLIICELRQSALGMREMTDPLTECTITIPLNLDLGQAEQLRTAALRAGFISVDLIEEPMAAARWLERSHHIPESVLVVCDLGHLTRLAVMRRRDGEWLPDMELSLPCEWISRSDTPLSELHDSLKVVKDRLQREGYSTPPLLLVGGGVNRCDSQAFVDMVDWKGSVLSPSGSEFAAVLGAVDRPSSAKRPHGEAVYPERASIASLHAAGVCAALSKEIEIHRVSEDTVTHTGRYACDSRELISSDGSLYVGDDQLNALPTLIESCRSAISDGRVTRLSLNGSNWNDCHIRCLRNSLLPVAGDATWHTMTASDRLDSARSVLAGLTRLEISGAGNLTSAAMLDLACLMVWEEIDLSQWNAKSMAVDGMRQFAHLPYLHTLMLPYTIDRQMTPGKTPLGDILRLYFREINPSVSLL